MPDPTQRGCQHKVCASPGALRVELWTSILLLTVHVTLLAWQAYRNSPTLDEVGHLPAGLVIWKLGRFDVYSVNPPLVRSVAALPVLAAEPKTDWTSLGSGLLRPEWLVGQDFVRANGPRSFWLWTLARWGCIPFSVLGGCVCLLWGRTLFGPSAGLMALALWCFSPEILGNAALITPDIAATSLGLLACWTFRCWLVHQNMTTTVLAGFSFGLAQLSKLTWVVLFGLWPILWLITCRLGVYQTTRALRSAGQLFAILLLGTYVLNLGYLFEGSFLPLTDYTFHSRSLGGTPSPTHAKGVSGNCFQNSLLAGVPIPFPRDYVSGLDLQKRDFEKGSWSYLRGEFRFGGWWYFYLYALAVKVPIPVWGMLLLALLSMRIRTVPIPDRLCLLIPPLVVLVLVSSQTGFTKYFRYVLPTVPFAFVFASQIAQARQAKLTRMLAIWLFGWFVASSGWCYPHSLSYFNELAGGPRRGHGHLHDANIDWGQDLLYLKKWIDNNPQARPLTVALATFVDLHVAELDFPPTPENAAGPSEFEGWHAVSVNALRDPARRRQFLLDFEPVDHVGYSILIYRLTREESLAIHRRRTIRSP